MNAKDLALGKINAGPQMFGMYVYGLTLGIDIIELAKIMNSPQGKAIAKVLQGNVFTGKLGATSVSSAISFLNGDTIGRYLNQFDVPINTVIEVSGSRVVGKKAGFPINAFGKLVNLASNAVFESLLDCYVKDTGMKRGDAPKKFPELILVLSYKGLLKKYLLLIQLPNTYFSEMIKSVKANPKGFDNSEDFVYSNYLLIEWLDEYADLTETWNSNTFRLGDLKTLAEGADEMKRLGTMLGSNKGVKSKIEDGQNFVNTIEESIIKRKEARGEKIISGDRIDYIRFCVDPEYREECIKKYENVKHSINILQVVAVTPHMFSYLRTCSIPLAAFMAVSSKYRSLQTMIAEGAYERIGAVTSQEKAAANKGLLNAVNATMMMQWLADTQKKFVLPAGLPYFKEGTNEVKVDDCDNVIALWTPEGLATFKMYMENEIIPYHLKRLKILSDNKFILGTTPFSFSQTGTRATVQAYTLTGDMMAKEGTALDAQLKEYKAAFKVIGDLVFPRSKSPLLKEGSTIGNMKDAFFLYAEYVFGGRKGPRSLMTLFDDGTSSLLQEFRKAIAIMDDVRDFHLTSELQIRAMAPNESIVNPRHPYYYSADRENIGVGLFRNDEKLLSSFEKSQILQDDPDAIISKASVYSREEFKKGELLTLHFLYPQLEVNSEVRRVGDLNITYDGKYFTAWEVTDAFKNYYIGKGYTDELLDELIAKDAQAIDDAIIAINNNMGVLSIPIYNDFKITMEVKNLDVLRAAIEMSLKHSRGEC